MNKVLADSLVDNTFFDNMSDEDRMAYQELVNLTDKPTETVAKMKNALLYNQLFGLDPNTSSVLTESINKNLHGRTVSQQSAWEKNIKTYQEAKTWQQVIDDGIERAGVHMVGQLAGMAEMEAEMGKELREYFW